MELRDRRRGAMAGSRLATCSAFRARVGGWEGIRRRWPDGIRTIEAESGYPDGDAPESRCLIVRRK